MITSHDIWSDYKGNLQWLKDRTLVLMKHGSHAYGTNTPTSDVDIKGVVIPPKEYLLGFLDKFEQADKGWESLDCVIFEFRKFFNLAADNNPNMIELPFVDSSDWITSSLSWELIVQNKDLFISQNCKHRFSGYAVSQLKRIHTHRRWLISPPTHKPERQEFGLPDYNVIPKEQREALEAMMLKMIEGWQVDFACIDDGTRIDLLNKLSVSLADMKLSADDQYVAAGNKLGLDAQAMEYLKAERAYRAALAEWTQYQTWLRERNPIRAAMEAQFGYDTKHAMHLVRLFRMCKEILSGQGVLVKRPDAQELLSIRNGAWKFDELIEWAAKQESECEALLKTTKIPKTPNRVKLNEICIQIIEYHLK